VYVGAHATVSASSLQTTPPPHFWGKLAKESLESRPATTKYFTFESTVFLLAEPESSQEQKIGITNQRKK
jgi:hypothetical protein